MDETHKANETRHKNKKLDTALNCLVLIARLHGIAADPEQIRHSLAIGAEGMSIVQMLTAAKAIGLKAKTARVSYEKLSKLALPAIAETTEHRYFVLAKIENDRVLILDPEETRPKTINKDELLSIWEGIIILCAPKAFKNRHEPFGLKWFIPVILKFKRPIFEALTASFVIQIFALVTPIFTQVIIDKVLVHHGLTTLDVLAIGLIFMALFEAVLSIARIYVFTNTTSKVDIILSTRVFRHLFSLPLRYFEVRRVGDTIARVRELENIRSFLTGPPLNLILDLLFLFVFIAVMFFYSPILTWVTLGSLPFFAGLSLFVTPILKQMLDDRFNKGAEVQSYLVEAVSGVQTIKSFALEPEVQKKWEGLQSNYVAATQRTAAFGGSAGSLGQFIQRAANLAILWFGAKLVMSGSITVGQLIAFQMLSGRVSGPILRLVQTWQDFQQVGISIKRLGDILNTTPEQSLNSAKTRLPAIRGHLRLERVSFRYRIDGPEVLRDFSVDIKPGTVVGIVGRSGSGKSTLAKLIQRLYIPEIGKISIDGIDISLADSAWLRRQIGVVLQENFLFNATVWENIAIHHSAASMSEIVQVAKLAGAHDFILELPEGYETMVGEKGTALSGGQRQRIAIARALLTNPRLLIFDEATSALDYESEKIIQSNLERICRGRTVLIIAHRLSTIQGAHIILVIDRGELVEAGTSQELMNKRGLYYYLYNQQYREERA